MRFTTCLRAGRRSWRSFASRFIILSAITVTGCFRGGCVRRWIRRWILENRSSWTVILNDLRYLYRFGEYISETELATARFMNELPEETVRRMADTYTEGYRKGLRRPDAAMRARKRCRSVTTSDLSA